MCGRASYSAASVSLAARSINAEVSNSIDSIPVNTLSSNMNASPGSSAHVFHRDRLTSRIKCTSMKWGLPSQSKLLFNARSETIYTKPTFQPLTAHDQSCIWAIDGYYEWKDKQPYFVCRKDGQPVLLAGLWKDSQRDNERSFTILTMDAFPSMAKLHPRQPVMILEYDTALKWLREPNNSAVLPTSTTGTANSDKCRLEEKLHYYPVTKRMSDGKYHGDDCTKEIRLTSIESFFGQASAVAKHNDAIDWCSKGVECKGSVDEHQKGVTDEMQQQQEQQTKEQSLSLKLQTNTTNDNQIWTCTACTYIHTGESTKFLACKMCGTKREISAAAAGYAECECGKGTTTLDPNGDDITSRAWGSLCSPKSAKKRKL
ncbi:hypothetical protein ACHAXN_006410 [Cyclotella atomus]